MKLTVLGGGGFRVPLVHRALLADDSATRVDELVLHDVDPRRLRTVAAILTQAQEEAGRRGPRISLETDLVSAVLGADFVFSAVRVGGLAGRVCDERAALSHGVLGQETTGAGGVTYGLRTVPVALDIARTVREHAPKAWVINFTNPAGMVTEAMASVLGDRVLGICDSPVGLFQRVARALDVDPARAWFDYAGLNHLGWLRRVLVDGVDVLPGLLGDPAGLETIEEGRLFGASWLATLGCVPNEYLWYWYYNADSVAAIRAAGETRGEFLARQQGGFFDAAGTSGDAFGLWRRTRREREATYMADSRDSSGAGEREEEDLDGGGYDRVALRLMQAIATGRTSTLVLNVRNQHTLAGLDADAVVEVPCQVDSNGARPLATPPLSPHALGWVTSVKDVERTTIEAARSGSLALATRALALHPLVDSVTTARAILATQLEELPELRRVLAR
ncbi:MAG: 6-phospho-beta-glucosidase [Actinomycetota bacterium]|nr:6-phospho-beta-glucosidase [Actinomycetota bacterium]